MSFIATLLLTVGALLLCTLGLGISYVIQGKSRLSCRRCGFDPTKAKQSCKLCGKAPKAP